MLVRRGGIDGEQFAFMRAALIGLIAAGFIGGCGREEALTLHGLTFPGRVQAAQRGAPHDLEKSNPGYGHSVQYTQPDWAHRRSTSTT